MKNLLLIVVSIIAWNAQAQTTILSTDFQQGIPSNYTMVNNDGFTVNANLSQFTSTWIAVQDPENPSDTVAATTSYFETADTASRWLITPPVTLGAFGNYISWNAKSHDPSFPDDYLVLISTTGTNLSDFTDTLGYVEQENFEWTNREVNLGTQGYVNQTVYFAFVDVTYDGFILYVDDIIVRKEDPVGISEISTEKISLYPNPTTDFIQIKGDSPIENVQLFDLKGSLLLQSTESKIDVQSLNKGNYIVRVQTTNGISTHRIIKL